MTAALDTTTFPCGHPRSEENTAPNHSRPSGRCRECISGKSWRRRNNRCHKGHALTEENTVEVNGRPRCRQCRLDNNRRARTKRRQAAVDVDGDQVTAVVLPSAKGRVETPDLSWTGQARCSGVSRDVESAEEDAFFKDDGERNIPDRSLAAARRYCWGCPVIEQCGAAGTAARWEGLWGGSWRVANTDGNYRITPLVPGAATPEDEVAA